MPTTTSIRKRAPDDHQIDVVEVARLFGCHPITIHKTHMKRPDFAALARQIGSGKFTFWYSDIIAYIESQTVTPRDKKRVRR